MSTIITKYSDYAIQSIEYFLTKIESEIVLRDIKSLTNGKVEKVNVTKQHPLVTLMAAQLIDNRSLDVTRSSIIPAISVTPADITDEGFTLGQSYQPEIVDDTWITTYKSYLSLTNKQLQEDGLITHTQINAILAAYKRCVAGQMRVQIHEWRKNEEINISIYSDTPDIDILFGNLMDSILADIQVGFVGDNSPLQSFRYRCTKGLTNFNFGRILFGTEYNITFMNTYNNYTIYTDDVISGHENNFTYIVPGESA
jgi:hypothetical protein